MLSEPTYLAARMVAADIEEHFINHLALAADADVPLAVAPEVHIIESVIDACFWASLRQEEGRWTRLSIALLKPEESKQPLRFNTRIRLTPHNLKKLAPAVETPGIHMGVYYEDDELYVWGTTHDIPGICFVIEVIEPGLLVIKHSRIDGFGKFVNVAVLKGDQIRLVDENNTAISDCPALVNSLAQMPKLSYMPNTINLLVELAVTIRNHRRGGLVLIVPTNSHEWKQSVVHPVNYQVQPAYMGIHDLIAEECSRRKDRDWQENILRAIEIVGGFTAVDGATIMTRDYKLLAFGAKVARSAISGPVEQLIVTEPVLGSKPKRIHPAQNGGTRHLAAAQFVHDQHDAIALVASQDGNFTIFAWSEELNIVHAHRIDVLLM
ncbi:hypothetical protein MUY27_14820 [Mucilaginibacter sp. RS28]|uniref:Probable sensor domain-containing protein n=1 Tax=Mucilaginibacter straminoryzae TaxID=2932774 RepID=A0A9X2B9S8_9SPHI|nr:hypothetical protein [Mucilaginibacter straminoryzae]MCJ8210989.1 hypothetical protein [Mucilaginibacter straminoryzae]